MLSTLSCISSYLFQISSSLPMRSLIFKTSRVSSYCCTNVWIRVKLAWTRPRVRIKSLISWSAVIHTPFRSWIKAVLGYEWLPRITAPYMKTAGGGALAGNSHLMRTEWRLVQYNSASLDTLTWTWIPISGPYWPMFLPLITCIRPLVFSGL